MAIYLYEESGFRGLGGFEIEPFGKDGLRLKYPGASQLDLKFDAKQYSEKGVLNPAQRPVSELTPRLSDRKL